MFRDRVLGVFPEFFRVVPNHHSKYMPFFAQKVEKMGSFSMKVGESTFLLALKNDASKASSASILFSFSLIY